MSYRAIFLDGPLGGQFREVPFPDHTFRVQVQPTISPYEAAANVPLELGEPETYELTRASGAGLLEYRWVNPAAFLRDEVKRLRRQVAELTERIDNAKDALGC